VAVLWGGLARAETQPEQGKSQGKATTACFEWNAGKGCPSVLEAERAVEDVLGRQLFHGPSCDLHIRASLDKAQGRGWQAELSFARQDGTSLGTRALQSEATSCQALKNPISLVVALVVEDEEAQATLKLPVEPAMEERHPSRARLVADVAAVRGLLPSTGLGNSLGADVRVPPWLSSRVHMTFWLPQSSSSQGRGGQFWAWQAGLALCPSLGEAESWRAGLCLGTHLGILRGTGLGLDDTQSATRMYGGADARALLAYPVTSSLALTAFAGIAVPWLRPRFIYYDASDTTAEIHRPHALQLLAGLGVEFAIFSGDAGATP
jgi:hypothetical protein